MNGPDNSGDKLRYDLVPPVFLRGIASAYTYGEKKHPSPDNQPNWINGLSFMSHYGAALRHLEAWRAGEDHDPESGLHHLACAGANIGVLMDMAIRHEGTEHDDRPPPIPAKCPIRPPD